MHAYRDISLVDNENTVSISYDMLEFDGNHYCKNGGAHLNHFSCSQQARNFFFMFHIHASGASVALFGISISGDGGQWPLVAVGGRSLSDSNFQWKMNNEHDVGHRTRARTRYTIKCNIRCSR